MSNAADIAIKRPTPTTSSAAQNRRAHKLPRPTISGDKLYAIGGLLLLLLVWYLAAQTLSRELPIAAALGPVSALQSAFELATQGYFWQHILASVLRVMASLALATALALPVGLLIGRYQIVHASSTASFAFLRMISPLSLMPVVVMVLGVGDAPIIFLLTYSAFWPIMFNVAAGVRAINPAWIQIAGALGGAKREILRHVMLPAISTHLLTGLRLAVGVVWIVLVPCEMLGVNSGLGYFILDTRDRLSYPELTATIVWIGVIGWLLDISVQKLLTRRHTV